ncbi:MAG: tRNA pseudouridine(38-40) synthase TruA [Candidatus Omnitrophica bacterium]|nr:tRNA pseudouridine(38-40) synthase TruA [Candidatus Omnitrophota bacterium]
MCRPDPELRPRRIRLDLEYDGTEWCGWQVQNEPKGGPRKGQATIQEVLEEKLSQILQEEVRVIGSGRTDSGVHAEGQVAAFSTLSDISTKKLQSSLNSLLPGSIAVHRLREVHADFHPQHDALKKCYRYRILNRPQRSALDRAKVLHVSRPLDLSAMERGLSYLIGEHDFFAFQGSGRKAACTVRQMSRAELRREGEWIVLEFEANGFLYRMVRSLVGTLLQIGLGKRPAEDMARLLQSGERCAVGPTAPAKGLTLAWVRYPGESKTGD